MAIKKQFVKVIFPFQYDAKVNSNIESISIISAKGKEKKLFNRIGFENVDLRKGLSDLFSSQNNKSQIVSCYQIEHNCRAEFGLPKRQDTFMNFYCRSNKAIESYQVAIKDINIYLFETGVGFVEAECGLQSTELEDLITCNYFLTEIKSEANYFTTRQKIGKEEIVEVKFTLKELLGKALKFVPEVKDFYDDCPWEDSKKKGIIYSYVFIEERTSNFDNDLFNLRMNYKASYKAPKRCAGIEGDPFVLQQFDNSYWASSYNGAVNVSIETRDDVTNDFFENNFYSKMQNEYFILFLAVLHQRYGIMKLMWEMGELDKINSDYENMKSQLEKARKYQEAAANMMFRDFFNFPSYVQHINDYYELLHRTFNIKELYEDFTRDLDNIEDICKRYVEKINARDEQMKQYKMARIEIFISVFGTLVGVVTFLKEAWELLELMFGIPVGTFSWPVVVLTIVLWIPSVIVIVNAINRFKEIRECKRKIKSEERECEE